MTPVACSKSSPGEDSQYGLVRQCLARSCKAGMPALISETTPKEFKYNERTPLRFASNLHGSYVMLPAKLDILRGGWWVWT